MSKFQKQLTVTDDRNLKRVCLFRASGEEQCGFYRTLCHLFYVFQMLAYFMFQPFNSCLYVLYSLTTHLFIVNEHGEKHKIIPVIIIIIIIIM
jgi:hypothetical protein